VQGAVKVTICWCFNEHGLPAIGIWLGDGTIAISPCDMDEHPGEILIAEVDTTADTEIARFVRAALRWAAEPHHCLPSPVCEICGAEAGSAEQAMDNAVMRGRLDGE
jgi:hypothetical protein